MCRALDSAMHGARCLPLEGYNFTGERRVFLPLDVQPSTVVGLPSTQQSVRGFSGEIQRFNRENRDV